MWETVRKRPALHLLLLGAASAVVYSFVGLRLKATNQVSDLTTFLAAFGICFGLYALALGICRGQAYSRRRSLFVICLFALLFRLLLIPAGAYEPRRESLENDLQGVAVGYQTFLLYDNDLWRHLWDAHALANGFSPYLSTPAELADSAWDEGPAALLFDKEVDQDVFDNVSFNSYTSVYPPVTQWVFLGLEATGYGSIAGAKLLLVAFDLGAIFFLILALRALERPAIEVVSYAWNPLLIKEVAGSGHAEAIVLFFLAFMLWLWSRRRYSWAMAGLALATAAKIFPALLVPVLMRKAGLRGLATFGIILTTTLIPFASDLYALGGGLGAYGSEWVFNSGPWATARELLERAGSTTPQLGAHMLTKALVGLALIWILVRGQRSDRQLIGYAGSLVALMVVLHPAVMPWYVLWPLPFVCLSNGRAWLWFSCACLVSYTFYLEGRTLDWALWVQYGVLVSAVIASTLRRRPDPSYAG